MKRRVLFLSTGKGVQSEMAAALLRRIDPEHFEASSATMEGGRVHPLAIEAMKEVGLSIEEKTSTAAERKRAFDFVIVLCDRARDCAERPHGIHWHFDDPIEAPDVERQRRAFRTLRDQIAQRLHLFVLVQVRAEQQAA